MYVRSSIALKFVPNAKAHIIAEGNTRFEIGLTTRKHVRKKKTRRGLLLNDTLQNKHTYTQKSVNSIGVNLSMADRDDKIRAFAKAGTAGIARWNFIPSEKLVVDDRDTDSYCGILNYENSGYEIGSAIQVRDWVFVLERMTEQLRLVLSPQNSHDMWVIAGFHGNEHYSFVSTYDGKNTRDDTLIKYVVANFWPILHPEVFDSHDCTNSANLKWVKEKMYIKK
jgi:hypothetical protein